jgi:prepilin signal peptidase PulO-like enzyme (type II secretory pathway)
LLLPLLVFLIGLTVGSFANVVICRLPRKQSIGGRSYCPDCGRILRWHDLAPILSFLALLGRCRYCRNKISWSYPVVEICSGAIWLFSFLFWQPFGFADWLFWVFILELFLILAFIDLKHLLLPNSIMTAILASFVCYSFLGSGDGLVGLFFSPDNLASAAFFFFVFFLIWSFSNGKGMGLGDAKLAGLIGFVFGFWNSFFVLYLAIIIGALVGLALVALSKGGAKTKLPLGAFISLSAIFFVLFGQGVPEKMAEFFGHLIFKIDLF